jgi:integrase
LYGLRASSQRDPNHYRDRIACVQGVGGDAEGPRDQVDLTNKVLFIADSKTPNGVAEVPLTDIAVEAFRNQIDLAGSGPWLFPSPENPTGYQTDFKKTWERTLRRAGIRYFRLYDLRSTHATRLSAGGVADEWVTQLLRQTDAKVFKKYSQMKLQMKR